MNITHKFVEYIPEKLSDGIIYISLAFDTAVHKCCCGCGNQVVTPLSPTDWQVTYDGESVSLYPSIGNWSFECQSHYWIENGQISWAPKWSKEWIISGRKQDQLKKQRFFRTRKKFSDFEQNPTSGSRRKKGLWATIKRIILFLSR